MLMLELDCDGRGGSGRGFISLLSELCERGEDVGGW